MKLSVAIPDSAVSDCSDIRSKTEKVFQIARIAAIFQIKEILIYHDPFLKPFRADRERRIIKRILQYLECPQYLRKRFFPLSRDTAAVGALSPLATPHHTRSRDLKQNEIREAAIFLNQGRVLADVGGTEFLEVINSPNKPLKNRTIRATTKIKKANGGFKAIILPYPPTDKYWGYSVHSSSTTLSKLLTNRSELKIATSRSCQPIINFSIGNIKHSHLLIAFGGPYKGIPDMIKSEGKRISEVFDACYNIMRNYGTRSLRLEEALMITFSKIEDKIKES